MSVSVDPSCRVVACSSRALCLTRHTTLSCIQPISSSLFTTPASSIRVLSMVLVCLPGPRLPWVSVRVLYHVHVLYTHYRSCLHVHTVPRHGHMNELTKYTQQRPITFGNCQRPGHNFIELLSTTNCLAWNFVIDKNSRNTNKISICWILLVTGNQLLFAYPKNHVEMWVVILFWARQTFHAKQIFVLSSSMKLGQDYHLVYLNIIMHNNIPVKLSTQSSSRE